MATVCPVLSVCSRLFLLEEAISEEELFLFLCVPDKLINEQTFEPESSGRCTINGFSITTPLG
jgi:hypothetical protein